MKYLNYRIVGEQLILVFVDEEPVTVSKSHRNYNKVLELIKECEKSHSINSNGIEVFDDVAEEILNLSSDKKVVTDWIGDGPLEIRGNQIYYKNEVQTGYIVDIILRMIEDNENVKPLLNFFERLLKNPNSQIRDQLYSFLEYGKNAITPDGCFLAYKYVNNNLKSVHNGSYDANGVYDPEGRFDHSIGNFVSMPRERCDNDPNRTCSAGLHVCSREYLASFATSGGNRIVVCKVCPSDVVVVPNDYNNTKMRTCGYLVVSELTKNEVEQDTLATSSVNRDYETPQDWYREPKNCGIDFVEYRYDDKFLTVVFRSGKVYCFDDVSYAVAEDFKEAIDNDDAMKYYLNYIEGNY